jgi:F-type H+-transporting ATPase subunit epsilon/F-type H+-transporting ATPase subunit delta|tara:strand:- start:1680 stop:2078 length:399 start_codon:yes stop_codon:yes gene_type:complete
MSEEFKIEIVNPEKSFLNSDDVIEVIVPAYEGELGILKDHISTISFLKPGIVKVLKKDGKENFFIEDGIAEFKDNCLSILTSSIHYLDKINRDKKNEILKEAEEELKKEDISDERKYLIYQKIDTLNSLGIS